MEAGSVVELFKQLGTPTVVLLACFWYIRWMSESNIKERDKLQNQHAEERRIFLQKDTDSDQALRDLMQNSNAQLLNVLSETNKTLKEMTVAISELKQTIHSDK